MKTNPLDNNCTNLIILNEPLYEEYRIVNSTKHVLSFAKYDQVFVPEHNFGAMENVGCVTYNENYMFRGETPTMAKKLRFSITNLHELAHMWFGNLVTMTWWNDLWLNEAFATALSYKACSEGGAFVDPYKEESWLHMSGYKRWGLAEDLMSSNHNI